MTPAEQDALSFAKSLLQDVQEYYPLGVCECELCRECGKMPSDCSNSLCATSCTCSECIYCRIQACLDSINDIQSVQVA